MSGMPWFRFSVVVITFASFGASHASSSQPEAGVTLLGEASSQAVCVVPPSEIERLREAQLAVVQDPSAETAVDFLAKLPEDFCHFDAAYGYDDDTGPAPLYEFQLWSVFPLLDQYLPADQLRTKYLSYAVGAKWDADNVNAFQQAYRRVALQDAPAFVDAISEFPREQRLNAYQFLFDGPHPRNHEAAAERLLTTICEIGLTACTEFRMVWDSLRDKSH